MRETQIFLTRCRFLARGICLVNWRTFCQPKACGGLGVLDLEKFSRALRLRWKLYEWKDTHRPWIGTQVPCDHVDSSLFDACTKIALCRGDKAKFWTSRWLYGAAPADLAPNLFRLSRFKKLSVAQAFVGDKWMQGLHRITTEVQLCEFTSLWIKV